MMEDSTDYWLEDDEQLELLNSNNEFLPLHHHHDEW